MPDRTAKHRAAAFVRRRKAAGLVFVTAWVRPEMVSQIKLLEASAVASAEEALAGLGGLKRGSNDPKVEKLDIKKALARTIKAYTNDVP